MNDMVERVAAAMCALTLEPEHGETWAGTHVDLQDGYRDMARAAIDVMRSPTDAMVERAAEALREYEFMHIERVPGSWRDWENLNEKIKQHFRGKVRVVVDAVGES